MSIPDWILDLAERYAQLLKVRTLVSDTIFITQIQQAVSLDSPIEKLNAQVNAELGAIREQLVTILEG